MSTCGWTILTNLVERIRTELGTWRASPRLKFCGMHPSDVERLEDAQRSRLMFEWAVSPAGWWMLLGLAHLCIRAAGGNESSVWAALSHKILSYKPNQTISSRLSKFHAQQETRTRNAVHVSCDLVAVQSAMEQQQQPSPNEWPLLFTCGWSHRQHPGCSETQHPFYNSRWRGPATHRSYLRSRPFSHHGMRLVFGEQAWALPMNDLASHSQSCV